MKMHNDRIKEKICHDSLIIAYGTAHVNKLRASQGEKFSFLFYRMRILGRLLLECESLKGETLSLVKLLQSTNFDLMIRAVQNMTTDTGKPKSLGLKIGHAVRRCCEIARCMAIKTGNGSLKCEAENIAILMNGEYSDIHGHFITVV